jgi:hypothetical protein
MSSFTVVRSTYRTYVSSDQYHYNQSLRRSALKTKTFVSHDITEQYADLYIVVYFLNGR